MNDLLTLEVHDLHVNVLTGIYSQETHLPQPLHISVNADLDIAELWFRTRHAHLPPAIQRAAASLVPPDSHTTVVFHPQR